MADTSQQLMIEMNRQLEELRLQQTKQAEEQSAWNQELKEGLKDVLREYFYAQGSGTPKQSPIDPSSSSAQETFNSSTHVQPIRTEPPDLTGGQLSNLRQQPARKEKLKCDELIHRDEEPSQILVSNETNSAKEIPHLIAHQVFDKIPASQDCHLHKLSDESKVFGDDYQNQAELKTLPTPWVVWLEEEAEEKERNLMLSSFTEPQKKSEIHLKFTMSGITNALLLEFENCVARSEYVGLDFNTDNLPLAFDFLYATNLHDDMHDYYAGKFAFDPGGGVMFFVSNLSYIEEISEMQKSFEASLFGIIMNPFVPFASECDQAKVNSILHKWKLKSNQVMIGSLFEVLIFDPRLRVLFRVYCGCAIKETSSSSRVHHKNNIFVV